MKMKALTAALIAAGIAGAAATAALAQGGPGQGPGYGPGYGWGPGMMGGGGWGPGMMGGGPGPGFGPGGGRGPGWGAGPGSGWGGGPGWGRGGFGPGGGPLAALNLTDDQREKVAAIQEENRRKNWETMGQVRSEQFKLRQMAFADKIDPNAFSEQQKKVDELRRQMLKSRVEARNRIDAILTPEQRKQFRQFGPWWMQDGDGE